MSEDTRHLWICGQDGSTRAAAITQAQPTVGVDCHRRLRGPYTGVGSVLRDLIPTLDPAERPTVERHSIEVLAVAPELAGTIAAMPGNLTTDASELERTRWWSRLRARRMSHGVIDLLRELAANRPLVLGFDRVDEADETDQEFLLLALRRLDPAQVRLVIGTSTADLPAGLIAGLREYADSTLTRSDSTATDPGADPATESDSNLNPRLAPSLDPGLDAAALEDLALGFIRSECTAADPRLALAYDRVPAALRARLHDERAAELEARDEFSLRLGAIPFHREHGADPTGAGDRALMEAISYDIGMGYYAAALELSERQSVGVDPDDFGAYYNAHTKRAQCLAALDRAEECEPLYYDLLSRTTKPAVHMSLYYALGMLYTRLLKNERKDHDRARAYLNTSIALASQLDDKADRAYISVFMGNGKALAEMHTGNLAESMRLVSEGIDRLDADLPPEQHRLHRSVLHHNRAQVLAGLGRMDEAMVEFDYVVEVDPRYPDYRFDRGSLHLRRGNHEAALADYEAARRLGPPFPELFYNRGEVYSATGELGLAIADFAYVLDLEPDHLEARISLASLLLTIGQPTEAAAVTRAGLGFAPDSARMHCTLGLALADLGELDAAEESFDQALRLDPALTEAQVNRAVVAYQQERFEAALEDLTAVLARGAENPDLLYNRGSAFEAVGDWGRAIEDYTRALSFEECDRAELLFRRAHCLGTVGRGPEAHTDLQSLLELGDSPYDDQVRGLLAASATS